MTLSSPARRAAVLAALAGLVAVALALSLAVGSRAVAPTEVWQALTAFDGSDAQVVVRSLRVPRTVLALACGAALGVAGALAQGHTRNPVADPGLLGVGAGAAFAVVLSVQLLGVGSVAGTVWFALAGALVAAAVVFVLGAAGPRGRGGPTPVTLVLAGAALTALLQAFTSALVLLDVDTLDAYRFWVVGSVAGRDAGVLVAVLPFLAAGLLLALANAPALDSLALGDDVARGLGVRVTLARVTGLAAVTLLTAAAVAACGPIGFVGLVAPHVARALVGSTQTWLVPAAGLAGGALLVVADVLGRVLARPGELQVGIVVALVGAPFFVALVRRRRLVTG